jgi:thiol-disulfide isomerase/thioredoxin
LDILFLASSFIFMNAGLNALLSKLKLIDQRKDATAPTYNEFDFSAAFDTLPVPANTSGSSILESSTPLLAIYFGAQWCPPCRAFSPKLSQFAKDNASQISVILCSADHSHVQAQQFARGKSFLVIPWTSTARSELQSYFKITSFPTLIVLDTRKQSCQVITRR